MRRVSAVGRLALAAVLALCVHAERAFAHARLKKSDPAASARLAAPPRALRLWFTETPEVALTTITLLDSAGHEVALGVPARDPNGTDGVRVDVLGVLAGGPYTVRWHTAASDGHPSGGSFTFRVTGAAAPVPSSAATLPRAAAPSSMAAPVVPTESRSPSDKAAERDASALAPAYVAARAVGFVALLLVIGAVTFRSGVINRVVSLDAPARASLSASTAVRAAVITVLLLGVSLLRLYLQSRMLAGSSASDAAHLRTMAMETSWGGAWRLQCVSALVALLGFVLAWKRHTAGWFLAAVACVILAFASSLAGHAGAAEQHRSLALLADTLHVIGAAAWLGSLLWLVVVGLRMRGTAIPLVRAFSPLALSCAALVTITGITSAWLRLGTLPNLWGSTYGQVLLLKLGVLAGVAGAGFYNWKRVQPSLGAEGATERLTRSASTELAIALGVVIVTAVLVAMPLPAQ